MTQFLSVDDQQMESPLYGGHFSAVRVLSSRTRRIVRLWLGYCIAMLNRRHSQAAPFAWRTRIDPAIRTKCSFSPFLRKQIAMSQFNPYEPTQSRIGADPNSPPSGFYQPDRSLQTFSSPDGRPVLALRRNDLPCHTYRFCGSFWNTDGSDVCRSLFVLQGT